MNKQVELPVGTLTIFKNMEDGKYFTGYKWVMDGEFSDYTFETEEDAEEHARNLFDAMRL